MTDPSNPSIDIAQMRTAASEAAGILRTLGNEDRLLLLCQLSQGEKSVSELATLVGVTQPTLSQQLGVLRSEGLVATRRDGKRIYYCIANKNVLHILELLYRLYCPTSETTHD